MRCRYLIPLLLAAAVGGTVLVDGQEEGCEFGCYDTWTMGGVSNGQPYCYEFAELTGRLIWSESGDGIGGNPTSQKSRPEQAPRSSGTVRCSSGTVRCSCRNCEDWFRPTGERRTD